MLILTRARKYIKKLTDEIHKLKSQSEPSLRTNQLYVEEKLKPPGGAAFDPDREESEEHDRVCHLNARVNLLKRIEGWATGTEEECIFWLQGMAGTGKSTISRTMTRNLIRERHHVASFFFPKEYKGARSYQPGPPLPNNCYPACPALAFLIRARAKHDRLRGCQKIDDGSKTPMTIVVVIDALDECNPNKSIERILRVLPGVKQLQSIKVKFLVTSRPEGYIRDVMGKNHLEGHWKERKLQEEPATKDDISLFVESRLKDFQGAHKSKMLPEGWPGKEKTTRLVEMTIPLFIFAATACRFIGEQCDTGTPTDRLEKIFKQKPCDRKSRITATYLPVLEQMVPGGFEKDESIRGVKTVVGPIVLLARALSVNSLAALLGKSVEIVDKRLNGLHSVLNVPSDPEIPITLFHQSFRDFLLSSELAKDFSVDETEVHKELHSRCLIQMKDLKKDICCQKRPGTLRKNI